MLFHPTMLLDKSMSSRHAGAVPYVGRDGPLILSYFIPSLLPEDYYRGRVPSV